MIVQYYYYSMADFDSDDGTFASPDSNSDATDYDDLDLSNDCYIEDNSAYYFERDGMNEDDEPRMTGSYTANRNRTIELSENKADEHVLKCARKEFNAVVQNVNAYEISENIMMSEIPTMQRCKDTSIGTETLNSPRK